MVWCRKYRKKIAEFRCETCSDAVKVQNQHLCGRPFESPVEAEPAKARPKRAAEAEGEAAARRHGRRRRGRVVRMREKRSASGRKPGAAPPQNPGSAS
ncbi:MAG TPA: hypothetical protein PLD23_12270 [Armatimonadota bacterium]|nr:hypothetical protein [Armatimonadota bacterium]